MKAVKKISVFLALAAIVTVSSFSMHTKPAEAAYTTTTATGYTKASDVKYNTSGEYIANWGARGEDCTFLTTYAQSFYTGSYVYDTMSKKSGGSTQSNASSSALYKELQTLMKSKHSYQTNYDATRDMYKYTDCVSNNTSKISSFYSGGQINGTWGSSPTWNREHTWPQSKSLNGSTKGKTGDEADIIMLRPTLESENSNRGNKAYGESSGYYDPNSLNTNVRGDCARIWLYVYVRWGNTQYAWGSSGVMENLSILLKWMEEDPVDTWEMGRNDVTEDITGTRNVFIDYPEYAWLLFGKSVPQNMSTPSGIAKNGTSGGGNTNDSSSGNTSSGGNTNDSSSGNTSSGGNTNDSSSGNTSNNCAHIYTEWLILKQATEEEEGKRLRVCEKCGDREEATIPRVGEEVATDGNGAEDGCTASVSGAAVLMTALGGIFIFMKKREG